MRSSTLDAPAAGNAWLAALTVKLANSASFTAEIVAAVLGCPPI